MILIHLLMLGWSGDLDGRWILLTWVESRGYIILVHLLKLGWGGDLDERMVFLMVDFIFKFSYWATKFNGLVSVWLS